MSDSSPTVQQFANAYHRTKAVLAALSDICIDVERWPDGPGSEEAERLKDLRCNLFGALGQLKQSLVPLWPSLDQLGLGAFEKVHAVGKDVHSTIAFGTALRVDASEAFQGKRRSAKKQPPPFPPLTAEQAGLVRKCVERLRNKGLPELQLETEQAFRRALLAIHKPPPGSENDFHFAPSGDGYDIAGFGEKGHFVKLDGFQYIEKLLKNAGNPVAMVELVGGGQDDRIDFDRHSRQPVLDDKAKAATAKELQEYDEAIATAEEARNSTEAQVLRNEKDQLLAGVKAGLGLGGRDRDMNNPVDKLRPRILGAIRTARERLAKAGMSDLAEHFKKEITSDSASRTVIYSPVSPPHWVFSEKLPQ